jgi:hypothetical protein
MRQNVQRPQGGHVANKSLPKGQNWKDKERNSHIPNGNKKLEFQREQGWMDAETMFLQAQPAAAKVSPPTAQSQGGQMATSVTKNKKITKTVAKKPAGNQKMEFQREQGWMDAASMFEQAQVVEPRGPTAEASPADSGKRPVEKPLDTEESRKAEAKPLSEHFQKYQLKNSRASDTCTNMLLTWKSVGHDEATLRELFQKNEPANQFAFQMLLMKELQSASEPPPGVSVCEVIAETASFFMP